MNVQNVAAKLDEVGERIAESLRDLAETLSSAMFELGDVIVADDDEGNDDDEGDDDEGYDSEGYDSEGYDSEGYDSEGYDSEGYDSEGYDREGFDSEGCDRDAAVYSEGYDAGFAEAEKLYKQP
jgi:hypothetical protein